MIDMGPESGLAFAKPERRAKAKARAERQQMKTVHMVRMYIFARERNLCRACRLRVATHMHEIRFRSQGGKVSRANSVAVCAECHQFIHLREIAVQWGPLGAEGDLTFVPETDRASEWLHLMPGEVIESPVMQRVEAE